MDKDNVHWPPRSPYEALISSPNGRKKAEMLQQRRRLAAQGTPNSRSKASQLLDEDMDTDVGGGGILDDVDGDGDEDEETLRLKLAAIEARLKLKRLQRDKAPGRNSARPGSSGSSRPPSSISQVSSQRPASPAKRRNVIAEDFEDVQVPLSPARRLERQLDPVSPRRVRMGIDKGWHASDVSLKWRAPGRQGGQGQSAKPQSDVPSRTGRQDAAKPKSFSDRILEQRTADKVKREKAHNIQQKRNTSFAIDKKELEIYHALASAEEAKAPKQVPQRSHQVSEFSREAVMNAYNKPNSFVRPSKPIHSSFDERPTQSSSFQETNSAAPQTRSRANSVPVKPAKLSRENSGQSGDKTPDPSKFEAYSGLHLSKRILPHSFLKRTFADAKPMRIPDLLKTVKGPSFDSPDTEGDYVVFGIVASKSAPREHKEKHNATEREKDPYDDGTNNSSKYMVLTLTDLKWSLDLFLFDTAFPRYYKLSEGTVIAILNPAIMPPPPHKIDTHAFSLTVSSSDDTILEIGTASDIGFCKSIRKDGKVCESWVDARKSEFCDFHVDLQLKKTKAARAGVNAGSGILGERGPKSREAYVHNSLKPKEGSGMYDRSTGSTLYVAPPSAGRVMKPGGFGQRSAASLIDADDPFSGGGLRRGGDKEERFRRRVAEQERERNIAKQLGKFKSVGSEYLCAAHHITPPFSSSSDPQHPHQSRNAQPSSSQTPSTPASSNHPSHFPPRDMLGLDNLTKSAHEVKLGRSTSKKRSFEADKDTPRAANTGKKTRFITPKGIRVAGRDSLGDTTMTNSFGVGGVGSDDDDLDIV